MKKILVLLLLATSPVWGANRVKTWVDGETLTASDLNAEFNNIFADVAITPGGSWTFTKAGTPITITPASAPSGSTPMIDINLTGGATDIFQVTYDGNALVRRSFTIGDDVGGSAVGYITIDGNAGDTQHFTIQNYVDVSHGLNTVVPEFSIITSDTFFTIGKASDTVGGALLVGIAENTATNPAFSIEAYGGAPSTSFSTSTRSLVEITGVEHNGADALSNATANAVIVGVRARRGGSIETVAAVDEDGDLWLDGAVIADGHWYINDTTDADVTVGITINQGANDDDIISLKSSDVAHGYTDLSETDTFLQISKVVADTGGVNIQAYRESAGVNAVSMQGYASAVDTTKSVAGEAHVLIYGNQTTGTGVTNSTADSNIFGVRARRGGAAESILIVDEDGDLWLDGAVIADGHWYINDTADTDVTIGLTINQAANDDFVIAMKSSDVAHTVTTDIEADTFGVLGKFSATDGGVQLQGLSEATVASALVGTQTTADTTRATTSRAIIELNGYEVAGGTYAAVAANSNILAVRAAHAGGTEAVAIVDEDGDAWFGGALQVNGTAATISSGAGAPGGACTTGAIYLRTDGGTDTTLYVCESTAWVAM